MKILLINTVPTSKNGITNVIYNYIKYSDPKESQFDYVSINQPEEMYKDIIEGQGGHIFVLKRSFRNLKSYILTLRKIISFYKYDAVHIHSNSHTCVLELIASRLANCVVRIVHAHTTTCKHVVVHRFLSIPFRALCTHGIGCGEAAGKFMFGEVPFTVLNNGVDTKRFSFCIDKRLHIRERLHLSEDDILIGHVGYFKPVKNQTFLLDLLNELYRKHSNYRMILIGDGPQREEIVEKIQNYGLDSAVVLTGNINNVEDYLNAIDLIVMPSLFEGLPLSLIEQQANGLKCVVSDTITREADKTDGLTFVSLKAPIKVWTDTIEKIARTEKDNRTLRSQKNIQRITECGYSIQEEARKLSEYYLKAIKEKKQ